MRVEFYICTSTLYRVVNYMNIEHFNMQPSAKKSFEFAPTTKVLNGRHRQSSLQSTKL